MGAPFPPHTHASKPTYSLTHPNTVRCHKRLFSGASTKWFSSGNVNNLLSTPRACSTLNAARPSEIQIR